MDSTGGQYQSLKNSFLVAMPHLKDPFFGHSVSYLCEHDDHGSFGLIINRPINFTLIDIFKQLDIHVNHHQFEDRVVLAGGPVYTNQGFILHKQSGSWENSQALENGIQLTTSLDILEAIAENRGPRDFLVTIGCAGWGAGQLEEELAENAWLTGPISEQILFHTPYELRAHEVAKSVGIDLDLVSTDMGHA